MFTVGGVGTERAGQAARALAGTRSVDGLLSIGFCGALCEGLAPGELILGGTTDLAASPELLALAEKTLPHRKGAVATVERVLLEVQEKRKVAAETGAVAVDMESAAVARAARERGVPFLAAKVVIDTPEAPLASRYESAGSVILELLVRPWILPRLFRDVGRVRQAGEVFRNFFVRLARELDPGRPGRAPGA
jgi:adenosylhomocysteine nucleosidase